MNNSQNPVARQEGLVVQEMPDEVLVYDLETNKAHCLNRTAAFVWKSCDGSKTPAQIARLFDAPAGKPVTEDLVWLAIDQLSENNLLERQIRADFKNRTRREVIKKIGLAAVIALPIVSSLVAPTAALAAVCTGATNGTACTQGAGGICCNGVCCQGASACLGTGGSCPGGRPAKSKPTVNQPGISSSSRLN